jgi:beta-galactosidase
LEPALMTQVAAQWIREAGVKSPVIPAPAGVKVSRRVGAGREVYILTNFSAGAQEIALPGPMTDVLNGGDVSVARLPRYGVAVLKRAMK